MVFNTLLATATAVSVLTPVVSATFDAQAKTNVVTYYVSRLYFFIDPRMILTILPGPRF